MQLTTVSAGSTTDRNVHLSVDVDQLNVTLPFQNGICSYRIFIRGGRVLVTGSLLVVNNCPAAADRIPSFSNLFT